LPSRTCRSPSSGARSSGSSAPTAPARPPPSRPSRGCARPTGAPCGCSGSTPGGTGPELRQRVGVQLQRSDLYDKVRVGEALELFASFYRDPADPDRLLEELELAGKRNTSFDKLSGGQRQRLSIALALVGNPEVAILDELSTGLDPHARRETWRLIEQVRAAGVTVVLVSHYMEEIGRLSDRVAVLDAGRVVAIDTPARLTARVAAELGTDQVTLDDAFLALTGQSTPDPVL
jgi:ABC-2 type transport system ATP-binding protein